MKKQTRSTASLNKQSIPLLSYKAEIIWDPQPNYTDEWNERYPKQKTLIFLPERTQSHKLIPTEKKQQAAFVNLERDNYKQDIVRRKFYFQNLKAENDPSYFKEQIEQLSKPLGKKKTRRHKSKFKIVKNNKNTQLVSDILVKYINENKKFVNQEIIHIPSYEKSAPFLPSTIAFADQLIEDKEQLKEKYGFEEKNLRKNNCILEQVYLTRLDKKKKNRQQNKLLKKQYDQKENNQEIKGEEERQKLMQRTEKRTVVQELPKIQNNLNYDSFKK